jgi:hypothetical protein
MPVDRSGSETSGASPGACPEQRGRVRHRRAAFTAIEPVETLPAADVVQEAQGRAARRVETSDGGGVRRWRC